MALFKQSGGRLFRIALTFTLICIGVLVLMSFLTVQAMGDMKELAAMTDEEGRFMEVPVMFYSQLIDNMKFGTVLASLSGVLIAIAARYGLRETSKNIGAGMQARTVTGGKNETVDVEGDSSAGNNSADGGGL